MDPARPLRDVFTDLAELDTPGAAQDVLRANGHPELSEPLVAEAVVCYADTAPHEVAEHLSPFVRANSPVPAVAGGAAPEADWFGLLATAPRVAELDRGADDLDEAPALDPAAFDAPAGLDCAFGQGSLSDDGYMGIGDTASAWPDHPGTDIPGAPGPVDTLLTGPGEPDAPDGVAMLEALDPGAHETDRDAAEGDAT